jgi:hypothetical protein
LGVTINCWRENFLSCEGAAAVVMETAMTMETVTVIAMKTTPMPTMGHQQ